MLANVPEDLRSRCWWVALRDGTLVAGDGGGGVQVLTELRLTRPLGQFLKVLRLSSVIDAFDKLIARYRKNLGKFVPDGPAPRRFP